MQKIKRKLFIVISSISVVVLFFCFSASSIIKHVIEKYDERYTGLEITMDWAYVNPITGYMRFHNLCIHEYNSDSIFFSAYNFSINISIFKLIFKTYELSEFSLEDPKCSIIQNQNNFNFNDLIQKFIPKKDSLIKKETLHLNILNIKIKDGEIYYRENNIPINYKLLKVNIDSDGKYWNIDSVSTNFSFMDEIGIGKMNGNLSINLKNHNYTAAVIINKFDLQLIGQYLKELTNYGFFTANIDADIKSMGNLDDEENGTTSGKIIINDLHFGKNPNEDYFAFNKLAISILEISPDKYVYHFDTIKVLNPYLKYELYDSLDNLRKIFGTKAQKVTAAYSNRSKFNLVIELADYIKTTSKNFFKSNYTINNVAIYNGDIKFNDYSISEKFSIQLSPFYFLSDSIYKTKKWVKATLKSGILPYGNLEMGLQIYPVNTGDFDLKYEFRKISASMFNPYTITYSSFPLNRGTLEMNGNWHVRNGIINSNNHVIIADPHTAKRVKNRELKWIPVPLILSIALEKGSTMDYNIPITGNLKNPKFDLSEIILDLLKNIFILPVNTPYQLKLVYNEVTLDESMTLNWDMRSATLNRSQEKFLKMMAGFMQDNPQSSLILSPKSYSSKEKEYILFFEIKKAYFNSMNNKKNYILSETDSMNVNKMSVKDPLFLTWINRRIKDSLIFTIQEKCLKIISPTIIEYKFARLNKERSDIVMNFFKDNGLSRRMKINALESVVPYNGFSYYKIDYKGTFSESVLKSYREMVEINDATHLNSNK